MFGSTLCHISALESQNHLVEQRSLRLAVMTDVQEKKKKRRRGRRRRSHRKMQKNSFEGAEEVQDVEDAAKEIKIS